ncbi:hypothetical protein CICLE_v100056822mg, partial [Citrus x clementina]
KKRCYIEKHKQILRPRCLSMEKQTPYGLFLESCTFEVSLQFDCQIV